MDYKYIEQLLERYWECQTTLDEEAILRTFFRQEDVPASLLPYRQLFLEEDALASEHVGKEFQEKVLRLVGEESTLPFGEGMGAGYCKARRMTFMRRLRPFYRAAGLGEEVSGELHQRGRCRRSTPSGRTNQRRQPAGHYHRPARTTVGSTRHSAC